MTGATLDIAAALARHERVALQFSGGRDSQAVLHLLRRYWGQLTVYFLDTGDAYPETLELVAHYERIVPRFVRVAGRTAETISTHGWPTDLLPTTATPIGRRVSGARLPMQDRHDCCARSIMLPMHEQMLADGITLIIRGQRDADYVVPPLRSGAVDAGIEYLYPIQSWSAEQVDLFLAACDAPASPFYAAGMTTTPDCMSCTAWLEPARTAYLERHHPERAALQRARLSHIHLAVAPHVAALAAELQEK